VVREDERKAFAKACSYLNYHAAAKHLALAAGVGTAVLSIGLLFVLWLFADLMVSRGQVPSFDALSLRDRNNFTRQWHDWTDEQRNLTLQNAPGASVDGLASKEVTDMAPAEQELLWRAHVAQVLGQRVGPAAAALVTGRSEQPLGDLGILSLIVRAHVSGHPFEPIVSWLARWNHWMWDYRSETRSNFVYYLSGLFLTAVVLALLRAVLSFVMREMAARASSEASVRMRRAVYLHTFRLGTLALRALGPAEAVSIFVRHVEAINEALYARLTVWFCEPVLFVLLLVFALVVQPWLALAFLLFALLVWMVGGQAVAYFRRQGRLASNRAAEQLTLIRESLMLMRLVKVYLMEPFGRARVERLLASYSRAQLTRLRGEAIAQPLLIFLGILAALVLLFVAGSIVLHGQLGVASIIALAMALVSLYWPVHNWFAHLRGIRRGREAAVTFFKFLERPGEVGQVVGAEFLPPMRHRVEFDSVTLREPGATRILLQDVTLTISAGHRIGLIGPDDLQKHAFVYLIPRLLDPTSGEIRIDQHNLRWVTLDSLRSQIAIVLQDNLVFHDTVANNIGCGDPAYTLPQIIEAAKVAHAHNFIQKLPQGYETAIGELGHSLSPSEQFRIGLARAILRDPALVIVEEPQQNLDEDTKSLLDDTFTRFLPGRTTIFLPHRISTIRSCDRIYLLHNGRIEAEGVHRELLSQNPLYRHLHYLEFAEIAEQV
jgi:ATP-binding cassette subfamily B protein